MARKPKYRSFEQLSRVAHEEYGDNNCCTVIALANATGWSYGKAAAHMARHGRKKGKGVIPEIMLEAYKAAGLELEEEHGTFETLGMTARTLTDGVYLVLSTRHVSAVRFGKLDDWATESSRKRVRQAWRVKNALLAKGETA